MIKPGKPKLTDYSVGEGFKFVQRRCKALFLDRQTGVPHTARRPSIKPQKVETADSLAVGAGPFD